MNPMRDEMEVNSMRDSYIIQGIHKGRLVTDYDFEHNLVTGFWREIDRKTG